MSTPVGSSQWMYTPASGFYPYLIDQSLRFNDNDSAQLTRTPSSAGNRQTWTLSCWVKRSNLTGASCVIFSTANSSPGYTIVRFNADNKLYFYNNTGNSQLFSDGVFRDTSAWYHIVAVQDSTNATAADRMILYVNGEKIPQTYSATYGTLSLNFEGSVNNTVEHRFGAYNSTQYFDGYIAEAHLIDGTALDATSFGENINGVWVPKAYSGSYGTNGFYLPFDDSSAIGDDESGNTNDWTANNLAASDVVPDSPTNNFATWNPLHTNGGALSEGNLKFVQGNNVVAGTFATPTTGKWYWELNNISTNNQNFNISIIRDNKYTPNAYADGVAYNALNGESHIDNTTASYGATYTTGDIIGVAVDLDSSPQTVTFYKNNTSQGALNLPSYDGGWVAYTQSGTSALSRTVVINFGQDSTFAGNETAGGNADANGVGDFFYAPPASHLALCSANLPEPTISPNAEAQADDYFNTVLYTGDGTTSNAITGVGFEPNWVWLKTRDTIGSNFVYDTIRGATKGLHTNLTDVETTYTDGLLSFDSDGFTIGDRGNHNGNNELMVAWNWKAGGTAVSNTDGSITSSVSAAPDAGFSIVSYTGTGANATVGHGLSSAPEMIIVKNRNDADVWMVYHDSLASDPETDYIILNRTDAKADLNTVWNDTAPTSNVFSIGSLADVNRSGRNLIAYCFHSVDGYSKVGSYVGNGSADGTFVYTGFRPAFLLLKKSSAAGDNWSMYDNKRDIDNVVREYLIPNQNAAAASTDTVDFLSNGFKVRNAGAYINTSGATYIYLAFAEAPFKYANAR